MKVKLRKFLSFSKKNQSKLAIVVLFVGISFLLGVLTGQNINKKQDQKTIRLETLQEKVIPQKGYVFKINWGNLGKRMIEDGVIDETKLAQALTGQDVLPEELEKYLDSSNQDKIELSEKSTRFWVAVLWGLGLANKNPILEKGPMVEGGRTADFASTGGYTLSKTVPMDYYSKFNYISLSDKQQQEVEEIAKSIYRPCCGNSTAFPDCNHGMAALALIELLVSQNFPQEEIYKTVLAFNSYWFPQSYLDIAYHFAKNERDYKTVSAKEILSKTFSSIMGYQAIKKQIGEVKWPTIQGGSC